MNWQVYKFCINLHRCEFEKRERKKKASREWSESEIVRYWNYLLPCDGGDFFFIIQTFSLLVRFLDDRHIPQFKMFSKFCVGGELLTLLTPFPSVQSAREVWQVV